MLIKKRERLITHIKLYMEHDKRVYIDMQFNLIESEPQLSLFAVYPQ